ncbi:MAG: hypothetical protein JXR83_14660 [Deltaproteobacteria bacterium]|nr:hypothetical protein [Deltaproteobacteria bacterium]
MRVLHAAAGAVLALLATGRSGQAADPLPETQAAVGSIGGSVRFEGKAPAGERFDLAPAERALCGVFKRDLPFEVGRGGGLRGVVVFLAEPAPAAVGSMPPEMVTLTMRTCEWTPRMLDATVGQALALSNQDAAPLQPELRWRGAKSSANGASRPRTLYLPSKGQQAAIALRSAGIVDVDCAGCRSWSRAEVQVFGHPFHDVTDERGAFEIHGVPAGTYTLVARDRSLGEQATSVIVVAGQRTEVPLKFALPSATSAPGPKPSGVP